MARGASSLQRLARANKLLSNVWTLDNILRVVSYSSLFLSGLGRRANGGKDTETTLFLLRLFERLTDTRFVNRLGGFTVTLQSLLEQLANKDASKSVLSDLGSVMNWSMVVYFPVEQIWLLSTLAPSIIKIDSNKWSMWSCRVWAVYIIADLVGTYIREQRMTADIESETQRKPDSASIAKLTRERHYLRCWSTCAMSDLVMALHWSVENGPVSDNQICFVGVYGGLMSLWLKWQKMLDNGE